MRIKIRLVDEFKGDVKLLPERANPGDAGFDIRAAEDATVPAVEHVRIPCAICGTAVVAHIPGRKPIRNGFCMEMEEGYEAQIRPRSGLARKLGISIPNSPATIDSGYRGELVTTLINFGSEPFVIKKFDRMAQMVICQLPAVSMELVAELGSTSRGSGGFGSTGVK